MKNNGIPLIVFFAFYFLAGVVIPQAMNDYYSIKNRALLNEYAGANIILYNANVITFDNSNPAASAIAMQGKHIAAIGSNEEVFPLQGPNTRVIDLGGRTVLPGLIDAHSHQLSNAYSNNGIEGIREVVKCVAADGYTTIHELAVADDGFIDALGTLAANNELGVRVNIYLCSNDNCNTVSEFWRGHPLTDDKEVLVRIIGVKIFADGGTCGKISTVSIPYLNGSGAGTNGDLFKSQNEMNDKVKEIVDAGYPIAMHTLGDVAARIGLNAFEYAFNESGNQLRCRMEHIRIMHDDMIQQMKELDLCASLQYTWARAARAGGYEYLFHADLLPSMFRWKDIYDAGIKVIGSNDFPATYTTQAMKSISIAATRQGEKNDEELAYWLQNQSLTIEQAIRIFTVNNAWVAFEEDVKGTITPGKLADLTILSANPLETDPFDVRHIEIDMTIMDGEIRHNNLIIPERGVHDTGLIRAGIYNNGRWGRLFSLLGFEYNGYDLFYYGSLLLCYNENTTAVEITQHDYTTSPGGWVDLKDPGDYADEEGFMIYEDYIPHHPRKLQIIQESYTWNDYKYLLIPFTLRNIGTDDINDLRIGFFADFDTGYPRENAGQWHSQNSFEPSFAFMYDAFNESAPYVGITVLNSYGLNETGFVQFVTGINFHSGSEEDLSARLLQNEIQNVTGDVGDYSLLVGSENYFSLSPGESTSEFNLVIAAGDDVNDLEQQFNHAAYKLHQMNEEWMNKNAARFSAADDYIEIPDSQSLNPEEITVEFYFRARDPFLNNDRGGEQNLVDKRDGNAGYNIRLFGTGYPLSLQAMFGEQNIAIAHNVIEHNTWYHAAVSQNGSELKIYINGELAVTQLNSVPYNSDSHSSLRVAQWLGYPELSLGFSGDIAELAIWRYERTQEMIEFSIQRSSPPVDLLLAGYWSLNSQEFNLINDGSYNANNGTAHGNIIPVKFDKELITDVDNDNSIGIPDDFTLYQNYPNPFNPVTVIGYQLPVHSHVIVKVYDILGNEVEKLADCYKPAGNHSLNFDAGKLASGIYFYQLLTDKNIITKKMILIK